MASVTMGIDLASQPAKTAVCLLRWDNGATPELLMLARGKTDDGTPLHTKWLSTTAYGIRGDYGGTITKVGIDAPFGWPEPYLDAVAAWREAPRWPIGLDDSLDQCRLRETDRAVHRRAKKWPLSVSSEKIALCAMRCAMLLTDIGAHHGDEAVARDGTGLCCEVYPDPALRYWTAGPPPVLRQRESYKDKASEKRRELGDAIIKQLPITDEGALLDRLAAQDDFLDALICALVARAAEVGLTQGPETETEVERAPLEGWIHLPREPLSQLSS